jgi:hypothetical protein
MKKQPGRTHQDQRPAHNRSYILRLWCSDEPQAGDWRASLEDPSTGERFGFSSLEQLFAFVMELSERVMNPKLLAVIGMLAMLLGNLPGSVFAAAPVSPAQDPPGPSTVYLPILFGPAPSKSSFELIEEALSAGELDAETALIYQVLLSPGPAFKISWVDRTTWRARAEPRAGQFRRAQALRRPSDSPALAAGQTGGRVASQAVHRALKPPGLSWRDLPSVGSAAVPWASTWVGDDHRTHLHLVSDGRGYLPGRRNWLLPSRSRRRQRRPRRSSTLFNRKPG